MPKFKAAKNFVIGGKDKDAHKSVKKGEHFECSQEYHDDHLAPHGLVEAHAKKEDDKEESKHDKKSEKKG